MQIKTIPNTNGIYSVTDDGRVFKNNIELKYSIFGGDNSKEGGYKAVSLKYKNGWRLSYVHRLVAEAFIPNSCPDVSICVNHKNEIKTDNNVSNLEWVTKKQNSQLSTKLRKNKGSGYIKCIAAYNLRGEIVGIYNCIKKAAFINDPEHVNSLKTSINYCILDAENHKSSRGYIWKRLDQEVFEQYKNTDLLDKKLNLSNIRIRSRKEKVYKPRKRIEIFKNDELVYTCNTLSDAARYVKTRAYYIKERAEKNMLCKGYRIKITEL